MFPTPTLTPNNSRQQWAHLPVTLPAYPVGLLKMNKLDLLVAAGPSCHGHLGKSHGAAPRCLQVPASDGRSCLLEQQASWVVPAVLIFL